MKTYEIEVKFIDGSKVVVEVEANDENEALDNAMPTNLRIVGSN